MARSAALDFTGEPTSLPIMHSEHVLVIAAKSREIASIGQHLIGCSRMEKAGDQ